MPATKRLTFVLAALVAAFGLLTTVVPAFAASSEKVLFKFNGRKGNQSNANLIFDMAGNLYGTTVYGAAYGYGVVFQLTPGANGRWTEKILHSFNGKDGANCYAGLVFDAAGSLYGTTEGGGAYGSYGTAFRLTPGANGKWKYSILHSFNDDGIDGYQPSGSLIFDATGNLYGTTFGGGTGPCSGGCGTVFELVPGQNGKWSEKVQYAFSGPDGNVPTGGVTFDVSGNLYGTTETGGAFHAGCNNGCGTAFQLSPSANGQWTETVLHNFGKGTDGTLPYGAVVLDASGNLFGTTINGGLIGTGIVFELTPGKNGQWSETVLHHFVDNGKDGANPTSGVLLGTSGNVLYGTTFSGGTRSKGAVFQLALGSGGKWNETILHSFREHFEDGQFPAGGLVFDASGNLYGTTEEGGWQCLGDGCGVVFEVTP